MKTLSLFLLTAVFVSACQPSNEGQTLNPSYTEKEAPTITTENNLAVKIVDQQLAAYNARDIDAFVATYADSVEIYSPDGQLLMKGHTQLRNGYVDFFANTPALHCKILNRITINNTVIDKEEVTINDTTTIYGVAIYKVQKDKIQSVSFVD